MLLHADQLAAFGGLPGIKDQNGLESAVSNPRNLWSYERVDDLLALAVRTGMAIARNHAFNDGNKRTAFAAMTAFLAVNGYDLIAPDDTLIGRMIEACVTGKMSEAEMPEHLDPLVFDPP